MQRLVKANQRLSPPQSQNLTSLVNSSLTQKRRLSRALPFVGLICAGVMAPATVHSAPPLPKNFNISSAEMTNCFSANPAADTVNLLNDCAALRNTIISDEGLISTPSPSGHDNFKLIYFTIIAISVFELMLALVLILA